MVKLNVPAREEVSEKNQKILGQLEQKLGFIPNLYAYYAHHNEGLADFLNFQNRKSTLKAKEREVVNLVTSEINGCRYCQSAHTALGKMNGFTEDQILDIRRGSVTFDSKINALVRFTSDVVTFKGKINQKSLDDFFGAGYTQEDFIDVMMIIGHKTISNYIHNIVGFEIDFPVAPTLELEKI